MNAMYHGTNQDKRVHFKAFASLAGSVTVTATLVSRALKKSSKNHGF